MIALCLTPALNSEYDTNIDISINDFVENEVGSRVFVRVQGECTSFERIIQLPIPSFELQKHRSVEPPCRILRDHLSVSIRGMPEGRLTRHNVKELCICKVK
ncbi:hypothetical protein HZH66_002235 [Vespula vulgaris]|uniref:Uncharacterized protein n=1 Tax=Vespula vulgaris TaxID=7454 RepID=A0A834KJ68_VESVU|nr:hypothetical protein HZH66_002235 [Vespula vulgaris]